MKRHKTTTEPRTVFELGYYPSTEETQKWLNLAPFGNPPVLHLPSSDVVSSVRDNLAERGTSLNMLDVLVSYHRLHASAQSSDIICGETDANGNKCGGIMDEEVSAFGIYYLCRADKSHKFPKP
jgi:hypothetical protein